MAVSKGDYEKVKTAVEAEHTQLTVQGEINEVIRKWIEKRLKDFPDEKPAGVG